MLDDLLGVRAVTEAVLVAIGEFEPDDPRVSERFRPMRLQSLREWCDATICSVHESAGDRPPVSVGAGAVAPTVTQ